MGSNSIVINQEWRTLARCGYIPAGSIALVGDDPFHPATCRGSLALTNRQLQHGSGHDREVA